MPASGGGVLSIGGGRSDYDFMRACLGQHCDEFDCLGVDAEHARTECTTTQARRGAAAISKGTKCEFVLTESPAIKPCRPDLARGYRFIVEGCDNGVFGSRCRQGWTISVTA